MNCAMLKKIAAYLRHSRVENPSPEPELRESAFAMSSAYTNWRDERSDPEKEAQDTIDRHLDDGGEFEPWAAYAIVDPTTDEFVQARDYEHAEQIIDQSHDPQYRSNAVIVELPVFSQDDLTDGDLDPEDVLTDEYLQHEHPDEHLDDTV